MYKKKKRKLAKDIGILYRKFAKTDKMCLFPIYTPIPERQWCLLWLTSQHILSHSADKEHSDTLLFDYSVPLVPIYILTLAQEGPQGTMWAALVQHRMMTLRYDVCRAAPARSP